MQGAKTRAVRGLGGACALAAVLAACGGGETPPPSGRSMSAPADAAARGAAANQAPEIRGLALEPRDPPPGTPVQARVEAFDADGDAVRLRFTWTLGDMRESTRGATLLVPADARKGTPLEVEVVASDGRGDSAASRAQAEVGNRPPSLAGVRLDPAGAVKVGQELVAVADAMDPDGDPVDFQYAWRVNGKPARGDRERLSTKGFARGDRVEVRVVANDGRDESAPADSPAAEIANTAPAITSLPGGLSPDGVLRYSVEASDPDGDRNLRFRLGAAPPGARIDPLLGEVVWEAKPDQVGTHPVEVVVADGHGGETQQRFEVTVREVVEEAVAGTAAPPARKDAEDAEPLDEDAAPVASDDAEDEDAVPVAREDDGGDADEAEQPPAEQAGAEERP